MPKTKLKHMDIGSRNARLCETLQGLGLYVIPIYSESEPDKIEYMHVAASLPSQEALAKAAECSAGSGIAAPVSGSQVGEIVTATENFGDNVIDFPSISGMATVFRP